MKNRNVLILLSVLLIISLIGNLVLLIALNKTQHDSTSNATEITSDFPHELIGTWNAQEGRKVEIFEDGTVYWTYNASGAIYTGYKGIIDGYSIILSQKYEGNGKGSYQSMADVPESNLQDSYNIYNITIHGNTSFSAQSVNSQDYVWSFIKSE